MPGEGRPAGPVEVWQGELLAGPRAGRQHSAGAWTTPARASAGLAWPGSLPLALSPDACYLHTHLWTNGQPAGSWSPCLEGGWSSQTRVWQFGLEPEVGGLPMEEARPRITPGALNPEPGCMTFH